MLRPSIPAPAVELLCLACRGSVAKRCPMDAGHPVVDVRAEAGLEELCTVAWEMRGARAGDGARWGGSVGAAVAGLGSLAVVRNPQIVAVAFGFGAAIGAALGWVVTGAIARRRGPAPAGSYGPGRPPVGDITGVVQAPREHEASSVPVAWQLEYTLHGRAAVTFRHGWCGGFEVLLDDGRQLHVAAGLVRLDAPLERWERLDGSHASDMLDASLKPRPDEALGGALAKDLGLRHEPVPYDEAHLLAVGPGDRVELAGELRDDVVDGPSSYRRVERVVRFVGLPCLRRV